MSIDHNTRISKETSREIDHSRKYFCDGRARVTFGLPSIVFARDIFPVLTEGL